jgi:hypothetical protein
MDIINIPIVFDPAPVLESELVEESEELDPNKLNEPLDPESLLLLDPESPKEKNIDTYTTRTITIITITLVFDNSPFI